MASLDLLTDRRTNLKGRRLDRLSALGANDHTRREVREVEDRLLEEALPLLGSEQQRDHASETADQLVTELEQGPATPQVKSIRWSNGRRWTPRWKN